MPRLSLVTAAIMLLAVYAVLLAAAALTVLAIGRALGRADAGRVPARGAVATAGAAISTVTYGLLPLLRSAFGTRIDDMRNSLRLQGRALPMLLFVTLFFFFTGELWQAMNRLGWDRVGLVLALFAAVTILASAGPAARRDRPRGAGPAAGTAQSTPASAPRCPWWTSATSRRTGPLAPVRLTNGQRSPTCWSSWPPASSCRPRSSVSACSRSSCCSASSSWSPGNGGAVDRRGARDVRRDSGRSAQATPLLLAGFGSMYFAVTSMIDAEQPAPVLRADPRRGRADPRRARGLPDRCATSCCPEPTRRPGAPPARHRPPAPRADASRHRADQRHEARHARARPAARPTPSRRRSSTPPREPEAHRDAASADDPAAPPTETPPRHLSRRRPARTRQRRPPAQAELRCDLRGDQLDLVEVAQVDAVCRNSRVGAGLHVRAELARPPRPACRPPRPRRPGVDASPAAADRRRTSASVRPHTTVTAVDLTSGPRGRSSRTPSRPARRSRRHLGGRPERHVELVGEPGRQSRCPLRARCRRR